ncbi:MAG TPA: hypothetical protein VGF70_07165 [Solirubrobacteraceae bacterium]|jgi:hypothetical protein
MRSTRRGLIMVTMLALTACGSSTPGGSVSSSSTPGGSAHRTSTPADRLERAARAYVVRRGVGVRGVSCGEINQGSAGCVVHDTHGRSWTCSLRLKATGGVEGACFRVPPA